MLFPDHGRRSGPGTNGLQTALFLFSVVVPTWCLASRVEIPLALERGFVEAILRDQVFTGPGGTLRLNDDGSGCQYLDLREPRVAVREGEVVLRVAAAARAGRALGGQCLLVLDWRGQLEFVQRPEVGPDRRSVLLQTTSWRALKADGSPGALSDTVAGWLDRYLPSDLRRTRISFDRPLAELEAFLALIVVPDPNGRREQILSSVAVDRVAVDEGRATVTLGVEAASAGEPQKREEPVLDAAELARLEQHLDDVDSFFTYALKSVNRDADGQDAAAALDVLVELRRDLIQILVARQPAAVDPARRLFVKAWGEMAPALRLAAGQLSDPAKVMSYLAFISAGDALRALDELGPAAGIEISSDGLRRLARMLVPEERADPLEHSESVDPELRRSFGFGVPIPPPEAYPEASWLDRLIPSAYAASALDPAVVRKLNNWVPQTGDMGRYLPMVRDVLRHVVDERARETRLDGAYQRQYNWLVFAAAWQESCWRQFVARNDKRVPMESGTGDIGIMQINPKVWRGFYDLHGLRWDLVYNARAGADILAHHLVNYGVRNRVHQTAGSLDNLARAAYAAYNGGPRQYDRYRRSDASARDRKIDALFFEKYRQVKSGKELGVSACYGG